MMQNLLKEVNAKGLDLYAVIQAASEMNVLNGQGIVPDKLDEVLARFSVDVPVEEDESDPRDNALNCANGLDTPVSPLDWDVLAGQHQAETGQYVLSSKDILKTHSTWEQFWTDAGFDLDEYDPSDIVAMTLEMKQKGHLARKEFDSQFPERPSASYVLKTFKEDWKEYSGAVERRRQSVVLPDERIDELLSEGKTVYTITNMVVSEYARNHRVGGIYRSMSKDLSSLIATKLRQSENEKSKNILTREDIENEHNTLENIAEKQIKQFRFYSGAKKAGKRERMFEDIVDYLVHSNDPSQKLSYLGLEGVNFSSYILLQDGLDKMIDPEKSVVAESKDPLAEAMRTIIDNCDTIEGGEIFEGLTLEQDYLHKALVRHKDRQFSLLNLDFMGGWSATKEVVFEQLFNEDMIADEALIYVTLLNSDLEKYRVENGNHANGITRKAYGTDDQVRLLEDKLKGLSRKNGYTLVPVCEDEYFDTQKMLFFGFYVTKMED